MSIQPRYDASFLAMNDELTITIMQKNKNELYEFLKRGFEASCSEAEARFSGLEAEALMRT